LECILGIVEQPLVLKYDVVPILRELNGNKTIVEIAFQLGMGDEASTLLTFAEFLDERGFLEGPRFELAFENAKRSYQLLVERPPILTRIYPADPQALAAFVQRQLGSPTEKKQKVWGVIAPHIDFQRSKKTYGHAYQHIDPGTDPILLLTGTSHRASHSIFIPTHKPFRSPLGTVFTDPLLLGNLAEKLRAGSGFNDEYLHRQEHSLELHIPFLQCLGFSRHLVPIIVGSFHHLLEKEKYPEEDREYETFVAALAEVLFPIRERLFIVASVDMAHVGRQFGDNFELTDDYMHDVAKRDSQYLACLCARDRRGLYDHIASDRDARRICGFPTLYTILDLMDRLGIDGTITSKDYQQHVDATRQCGVTFASLHIERNVG
jgi:hypothetical protein